MATEARRGVPLDAGSWTRRPPGVPSGVPPPSVPLAFLLASGLGLVACGVAFVAARGAAATDPTADAVVAAVHLGVLATLSMGVLGALHQFVPVVTGRALRSVPLARATFLAWFAASWLLPLGVAFASENVVESGGALAALAISLAVANLSLPLAVRATGPAVTGLRLALGGFVVTACFGVLYVADRRGNWFVLSGHVVLAHALIGLFAWLGLTYVSVAEKLWPMFFLAHVPGRRRAGRVAVWAVPAGVALVSPGVLTGVAVLDALGAALLVGGLAAHLWSLVAHVRHRRRKSDLHLIFVVTSAGWLGVGAVLALTSVLVLPGDHHRGVALVAAAVAAFGGWLLEALVGHLHKVVPFIAWSVLRARGITTAAAGRQIMFADLYKHLWAVVTYVLVTTGIGGLCVGLSADLPAATALGGALLALTGLIGTGNLALTPIRLLAGGSAAGGRGSAESDANPQA